MISNDKSNKKNMKEPSLSLTIENKTLQILYSNIDEINIKFYEIDLEIVFSMNPFIKQNKNEFSFVKPKYECVYRVDLSQKEKIFEFPIIKEFLEKNIYIEVSSKEKKCFDTYFSAAIKANITETLGEVKVVDTNLKPLPKVYVKCFAMYKNNIFGFYKDGYTDLRGRFNYLSLNTDQLNNVSKFALFIMHEELGSIIKECNPPSNVDWAVFENNNNNLQGISQYDYYQQKRADIKNIFRNNMNQQTKFK
jgi:hypothetical protein